jgi:hypothetical protein
MVTAAFGDVQVAGVFDGRGDGGADGGQVNGPRRRYGWWRCLHGMSVPDVVVRVDGLQLAASLSPPI